MLSKLIKYEIKATGRIFLPLLLALLIFAGITRVLSAIGAEQWDTPAVISMIIYIITLAGMFVLSLIMMIQRFYKNLLTDEGYLMHTLPVKTWKHIISKLLVSMLWMTTSLIAALISILIIALKEGDLTEIIASFATVYHRAIAQYGSAFFLLSLEIVLGTLVSIISGILMVYASIALGQLVNRHKTLVSFGAFIVLSTISQVLLTLIGFVSGRTHFDTLPANFGSTPTLMPWAIACGIIFTGLLSLAYFAITNFILSKRLNLE